jgi:hypothetical protein
MFIHIRSLTHINTYAHSTPMSTSERVSQLDLEIHEVDHQECIAVDGDVVSH